MTCCSAFFTWSHEASANIHDVDFKLNCDGSREYDDPNGELIQEKNRFDHLSISSSKHIQTFLANNISANMRYVCAISSVAGNIESPPSQQVTFTSQPGGKCDDMT